MKVIFTGCEECQWRFGGCKNPNGILKVGEVYKVVHKEIHSWHTKLCLEGVKGPFNSVCFEEVE